MNYWYIIAGSPRNIKTGLFFVFFVLCITCMGQQQYNLVPNYSFEQYTNCPSSSSMQEVRNSKPDYWYKPDKRGAIYYNSCANVNSNLSVPYHITTAGADFQYPRTGVAYIGMFYYNGGDVRNYFQIKLTDSLKQDKCYYAEYFVSCFNSMQLACNNQAMLFTNNPIYADTAAGLQIIPANPQVQNTHIITDTLNWVKVSGVFTAQGGEQYLTLGNFKNNAETNYQTVNPSGGYLGAGYYVDDVSVLPLDSITLKADAGTDKTITQGDSVFIGSYTTGLTNVTWYNATGSIIATNTAGLYVQPTTSTFYVIEQNVCGQYSTDTVYVSVGVVPLVIKNYELRVKNGGVVNKWITLNEINVSHFNVQRSDDGVEFYTINKTSAKNNAYNEYSFVDLQPLNETSYYRIEAVDKDGKKTYSKTLSITTNFKPQTLNIYPNPTTNIVNISFPDIKQVSVIDITGRIVLSKQTGSVNNMQLNVGSIGKGIFLVRVTDTKGNAQTSKLAIQ